MTDANSYFDELVSEHKLEGCRDVYWNLGQVLVWIETRDPFLVDAWSDTPELASRDHSMPAGLPRFSFGEDENEWTGALPFQSIDELHLAASRGFQSGLLTASGRRRGSFEREPIDQLEWADLIMDYQQSGGMTLRRRDGFVAAWSDIRVKGEEVRAAFPLLDPRNNAAETAEARSAGAKDKWDWGEGKLYAAKIFAQRGDFKIEQNQVHGWKAQADLVKLVQEHLKEDDARSRGVPEGNEPGLSTTKGYVARWLVEWRGQQ